MLEKTSEVTGAMAGCDEDERVVYLCSECGDAFESSSGIVDHLTTVHKEQKTIRKLLRIRDQRLKREKPKKVRCVTYHCDICTYKTLHRTTYERHMMKHTKMNRYKCPICPYSTVQGTNVRRHIVKRHPRASVLLKTDPKVLSLSRHKDKEAEQRSNTNVQEGAVYSQLAQ